MLLEQDKPIDTAIPQLRSLYFYLTSYCNLKCFHCWISPRYTDKNKAPKEANFSLLKDIINQALPLGLKNIKITGGEPFLSRHILNLISYAYLKKLDIFIETNGTLIDDDNAEFLKKNGVKFVSVSLDGPDKRIHESLRGNKECFDKTVEGIKSLKRSGLNIQVIMSIHKGNIDYLDDTIDLAENLGANSFKINCISEISRGRSFKRKGLSLNIKDYVLLNKKIDEELQPKYKIKIIFDIPLAFKRLENIKNGKGRCGIKNILGVMSDGSISICGIGEILSSLRLGNIEKESLRQIWENSSVLRIIREGLPSRLEGICGKCIFKALCLGKCRAGAYYKNNSLLSPFSFCEEAFQLGLFPRNRMFDKATIQGGGS
jgi:SynChlorMet cassette radical SAM/SPASM protein ScmF